MTVRRTLAMMGMRRGLSLTALAALAAACGTSSTASPPPTPSTLTPKQVFDLAAPATVELHGKLGHEDVGGTGFVYDAGKGLIITNAHVVSGLAALKAKAGDQGEEVPVRVVGSSPCDDVAVVQFATPPSGLKQLPFGDSKTVKNEDEVVALGYPASFADPSKEKVVSTNGTVQSADVAAEPDKALPKYPSTIQHSATINPGNSGGPLLNNRGQVVGINALGNPGTSRQPVQGQYYAISIDHVKPIISQLAAGTSIDDVGWDISPFSEVPLSEVFTLSGYGTAEEGRAADQLLASQGVDGLFVLGSDPASPSEKAGLVFGDLITTIQDVPVTSVGQACDILQSASPGQTLALRGRYLTSGGTEHQFGEGWTTRLTIQK